MQLARCRFGTIILPNADSSSQHMEELLTPVKQTLVTDSRHIENDLISTNVGQASSSKAASRIGSPDDAISALNSKPDHSRVIQVLRWLDPTKPNDGNFNIRRPGPTSARILFTLVAETVPVYWDNSESSSSATKIKSLIIRCLQSVSGIRTVASRIRLCLDSNPSAQSIGNSERKSFSQTLEILVDVLENLLEGNTILHFIWRDVNPLESDSSQQKLLWKDFVSLFAGGGLLSLVARASHILNELDTDVKNASWLSDGSQYSIWLSENVVYMLENCSRSETANQESLVQVVSKALTLGYTGEPQFS